jgi:hypothetical protein
MNRMKYALRYYPATILLVALILLVLLPVLISLVAEERNCRSRGGEYVRGVIWFQCVGEKR